jgi:single-strand DNA-binding protein
MGTHHNLVILSGTVTLEPTLRELRDGVVLQFDVSTALGEGSATSVPVAWHDPTAAQTSSFGAGDDVVVTGTVRRRFFRVGGQTQSRTEVIVASLTPARRKKSANSALAAAADSIRPADG